MSHATIAASGPKHASRPRIDIKTSILASLMLSLSLSGPPGFTSFACGLVSLPTRFRSLKDRMHYALLLITTVTSSQCSSPALFRVF